MRRALPLLCGALPLIICAATPPAAWADGRPVSRRVELVVARPLDSEELKRFETALRDVLLAKSLGLSSVRKDTVTPEDVALATTASPGDAASIAARLFIDFTAAGHATLFLIDPRRGRIHVRRVMLDHGFDAVAREGMLFVIQQSIDAILEGREIGVTREEYQRSVVVPPPPPPAPPPPTVPIPPRVATPPTGDRTLLLGGGYDGVAMGSGAYQHAARLVFAARLARVQIGAGARFSAPLSIAGDGVQARLWAAGVSVSGAARLLVLGNLSVSAGLGGGLDITRVEPAVTGSDLQATTVFWARGPSLRTFVEIERLFGNLSLSLVLGAEAHLLAERYTVKAGSDTRDVFVPRRLRPEAAVLVGVLF